MEDKCVKTEEAVKWMSLLFHFYSWAQTSAVANILAELLLKISTIRLFQ